MRVRKQCPKNPRNDDVQIESNNARKSNNKTRIKDCREGEKAKERRRHRERDYDERAEMQQNDLEDRKAKQRAS